MKIKYYNVLRALNESVVASLEYNREATLKMTRTADILRNLREEIKTGRDPLNIANLSDQETLNKFAEFVEDLDTTPNKELASTIIKMYSKTPLMPSTEIEEHIVKKLELFKEAKKYEIDVKHNDPLQFSNAYEFSEYMKALEETILKTELDTRWKKGSDKGQYKIFAETEELFVVEILDAWAARHFGLPTSWCTASSSRDASGNHFSSYCRDGGRLFVILPKETQEEKERYQAHFTPRHVNQLKDKNNNGETNKMLSRLFHTRFSTLRVIRNESEPFWQYNYSYLINYTEEELQTLIAKVTDSYLFKNVIESYIIKVVGEADPKLRDEIIAYLNSITGKIKSLIENRFLTSKSNELAKITTILMAMASKYVNATLKKRGYPEGAFSLVDRDAHEELLNTYSTKLLGLKFTIQFKEEPEVS
jgi:hypothetical protein